MTWKRIPIKNITYDDAATYPAGANRLSILNSTYNAGAADTNYYVTTAYSSSSGKTSIIQFYLDTSVIPLGSEIKKIRIGIAYKFADINDYPWEFSLTITGANMRTKFFEGLDSLYPTSGEWKTGTTQWNFDTAEFPSYYIGGTFIRKDLNEKLSLTWSNYSEMDFKISALYFEVDYYEAPYNQPDEFVYIKSKTKILKIPLYKVNDGYLNTNNLRIQTKKGVRAFQLVRTTVTDEPGSEFKIAPYKDYSKYYIEHL